MTSDKLLQDNVLAELNWDPRINAAHVGVTAKGGVVTLTGHVENYSEKSLLEETTWRVKGVKGLAQDIEVRLPNAIKKSDEDIAEAVLSRLSWDVSIPNDTVSVKVQDGWITLSGEMEWQYQKIEVEEDIRKLMGVTGVLNKLTLKPRVNTSDLSIDIRTALHRSWLFDPNTITIKADGGKVKLTGTTTSWHDKEVAGNTAWAAKGATSVENDIVVVL